jgi:transcriptional regulator with XRE-family HTH domain
MKTETAGARWYADHPNRWDETLEDALASGDFRRRNLAWIIILEVGGGRGCQGRFGERIGKAQGIVSNWLRGKRELNSASLASIAKAVGRPISDLETPCHPLAVSSGGGIIYEPGDAAWLRWWAMWRLEDPINHPPVRELVRDFPDLFPADFANDFDL